MHADMVKLKRDKTELLVIGPKRKVNPPIKAIYLAGDCIEASSSARNVGVIFDLHVNPEKHVMNTCKMAFYDLRNMARIRNSLRTMLGHLLKHLSHLRGIFAIPFCMAVTNRLLIGYNLCKIVQLDW